VVLGLSPLPEVKDELAVNSGSGLYKGHPNSFDEQLSLKI
jgi:hypothetical protein